SRATRAAPLEALVSASSAGRALVFLGYFRHLLIVLSPPSCRFASTAGLILRRHALLIPNPSRLPRRFDARQNICSLIGATRSRLPTRAAFRAGRGSVFQPDRLGRPGR